MEQYGIYCQPTAKDDWKLMKILPPQNTELSDDRKRQIIDKVWAAVSHIAYGVMLVRCTHPTIEHCPIDKNGRRLRAYSIPS